MYDLVKKGCVLAVNTAAALFAIDAIRHSETGKDIWKFVSKRANSLKKGIKKTVEEMK